MGTELELAVATDEFAAGTKVWPPYEEGETPGLSSVNKLAKLQCDTSGNSVYSLRVRNTNHYGAWNIYQTLYTDLLSTYGSSTRDVLFFGYDWRNPNSTSGTRLKNKVNEYDRVIIVAHSMGGLVTSHMLTDVAIRNKIEKVITLGTPYFGSLEMLPVMSHGHFNFIDKAVETLSAPVAWIAKEVVLQPVLQTMSVNIPSLYELLPTKQFFSLGNRHYYSIQYLFTGTQTFTTFEDTKTWLPVAQDENAVGEFNRELFNQAIANHDLLWNNQSHITSNVETYYIAGEKYATNRTYQFKDGFSDSYSTTSVTAGDSTVLSYSATMNDLYASQSYFTTAEHMALVNSPTVIGFIKDLIDGNTGLPEDMRSHPEVEL